ncbi:related to integral membrane protein PTH11 [Rhynchosporium agropyri]|uniref:Related to integral membrane protein PTH11 n=1 Tax=Rhynchosporium agropyri TaxID=914238 RepID=A0A1E1KHM8_9HELO|nr:related to integral membrane protein PTH11 [Rhynchosporium agropyri]
MKKAFVAILFLAAVPLFTLAVKTGTEAVALLKQLPPCALTCLATSVAKSTCSPTDTACVCSNAPLNAVIRTCVQSSCRIKAALKTLNVTHHLCEDPIRDARNYYNTVSDVFGILSGIAVLLRLYSRWISAQHFWYDDYIIAFAIAIGIPGTVMNVKGCKRAPSQYPIAANNKLKVTYNGLGLDIWQVGYKQITDFIHVFFAMELLYFTELGMVKMSILFFYLRLFPSPTFRRWVWGTAILNGIFTFLFVTIGLFSCAPLSFYWKRWDGEHKGKCLNINALGWSHAAVSIAFDIWMLALPMFQLRGLKLHWKKKIGVASMFGVGAFVTLVSILRLRTLVKFAVSQNPTWDYTAVGAWSTVEINTAIICACMPNLRLLLVHYFPRFMESSRSPSYAISKNRNEGNRAVPGDISTDRSIEGSNNGSFRTADFSSEAPDDSKEKKTSLGELPRVESRKYDDNLEYSVEPDHERKHETGNWI